MEMKKFRHKLWLGLALAVTVILLVVLALPFLVDADRYRGLIEEKAEEALGRDVRLGEIQLSILPALGLRAADVAIGALPEEGGGDLVTAASLRIGARLLPLLSQRLEVTSIVLEEPSMVLARDPEGSWNVERLVVREPAAEDAATGDEPGKSEVSIASLRLTGGRVTLRDAARNLGDAPASPPELVFTDLDLELEDYRPGSTASFELETAVESVSGARLKLAGEAGPFADGLDRLAAEIEFENVTGPLLADLAGIADVSLEGALGERAFDASGRFDIELGDPGRVQLGDVELEGVELVLSRDRDGSWNVERIGGSEASSEGSANELRIDSLRLRDGRLILRDAAAPGEVVLADLDLELRDIRPDGPASFELAGAFVSAPGARLEISGDGSLTGPAPRLEADLKLEQASGKLLARFAAFVGVSIEDVLVEDPVGVAARLDADLGSGGPITVAGLELTGAGVDLRRDRGGRWNFELPEGSESGGRPVIVRDITVDGGRIHLRDASAGVEPVDLVLDELRLELDRLPTDGPAAVRLTTDIEVEGGRGSLEVSGSLGPLGDGDDATPVELTVGLRQLPLAVVRPLLGEGQRSLLGAAGSDAGEADLDLTLAGAFPAAYTAAGSLGLAGARLATGERVLDLDLGVRFDLAGRRGVEALDFKTLDLELRGTGEGRPASVGVLALGGSVEQVVGGRLWDMTLAPTRLPAEDLAALLELLVADFEMDFDADAPVMIEARATGLETADQLPDLKGRLELRAFDFRHPSLARPIERVDADVAFEGESVWVTGLAATVGGSELTGDLTLIGWQKPRVTFDLSSPRADVGEVLSAFESTDVEAASEGESAGPSLLELISADGDLRLASGSWDTLDFTDLSTRVHLEAGVMTLDPVALQLYDGAFSGRVVADLRVTPAAFEIRGDATAVDLAPFLAANLEVSDALYGRFTGEIEARGAGDDYDSIVGSLTGGGSARLEEGRLGRLSLLGTVARVSGVLGQHTLASVANRVASESTRFEKLQGNFRLANGTMAVSELILESPDFGLQGQAEVDLLGSTLGGQFQLAFSELLSDSMQREASRAGELFWNPEARQVIMPLALTGSVESPVATVDWSRAVQRYATGRAIQELTGLLGRVLGSDEEDEGLNGVPPPPGGEPGSEPEPWEREPLEAEITRVRWGGSVLLQDLKLEGTVRGREIERATLVVLDARGTEVERIGRLAAVDAHVAGADPYAEAEIRWDARVDGKDLVLATFPLTVTLTVYDRSGDSAEASTTVEN